jgi:hypothetical protein
MTEIRTDAWWCKYCCNNKGGCIKDVPYYCSSMNCMLFSEGKVLRMPITKETDWSKILVEVL